MQKFLGKKRILADMNGMVIKKKFEELVTNIEDLNSGGNARHIYSYTVIH